MPYPWSASDVLTADDLNAAIGEWAAWTPTLANLTAGSTPVVARYVRTGDTVFWEFSFIYSAGASVGTVPTMSLPVAASAKYVASYEMTGSAFLKDASGGPARRLGGIVYEGSSVVSLAFWNATPTLTSITSTAPWTWTTDDTIKAWGIYEAA